VISEVRGFAEVSAAWGPSLSPDGAQVAFVGDRSGLPRLLLADLDGELARTVSLPEQEVVSASWSPDGEWLAYLVSPGGSIRSELHVVRPDGTDCHLVAGGGGQEAVFGGCWTGEPGGYAFTMAGGGPGADIRLADIAKAGERPLVGGGGFLLVSAVAQDGRWVLARRGPRGERHVVLADTRTGATRRLLDEPLDGEDARFARGWGAGGGTVYLRTTGTGEFIGLGAVGVDGEGRPGPLGMAVSRPDADLEGYALRPDGHTAVVVWNVDGRSVVQVADLDSGEPVGALDLPLDVVTGWALHPDGRTAVFCLTGPQAPRGLWRCRLDEAVSGGGPLQPVPATQPTAAERATLARAVRGSLERFEAHDGLILDGWLYRAPSTNGPGPTVVSFHGGPEAQERPGYAALIQALACSGISVFAPNPRGSSGYGRTFTGLDDGEQRGEAVADVLSTVRFLSAAGIADSGRTGAVGWSYGGYLTLLALVRWPELFAAGCAIAGMSDLRTFFAQTEPWVAAAAVPKYGDPRTQPELLRELSPIVYADRLLAPTLLVHGDRDTNVPYAESVRMHAALRERDAVTELLRLPGEGHAVVGQQARVRLAQSVVGWFERWL
jgi:dipeptidyl aminopeptidase/acylaminoacyl peptidase